MDWLNRERSVLGVIAGGSESAFMGLVDRHQPGLFRFARCFVDDPAAADAAVEQTWRALLGQLTRFDGGAPLKVWLYGTLLRVMKARHPEVQAAADPSVALAPAPAVNAERFSPPGHRWEGHWARPPQPWPKPADEPEAEPRPPARVLEDALVGLPRLQRAIVLLHDTEKLEPEHLTELFAVSEPEFRKLLHAGRSQLWAAVERHHAASAGPVAAAVATP